MGVWGVGIFSDDTASDVRDEWREALEDGLESSAATERVLSRYLRDTSPEEANVVWLALAAAQARSGRLLPEVRDRALAIIDSRADLRRWEAEDTGLASKRAHVLDRLAGRLRGPQRSPTRIRRRMPHTSPLDVGDVVHVRGDPTGEALFVVVDLAPGSPKGSTWPVVAPLAWNGGAIPSAEELASIALLREFHAPPAPWADSEITPPPRPLVITVMAAPRGQFALDSYGEVVATGIARSDAPNWRLAANELDARDSRKQRRARQESGPYSTAAAWFQLARFHIPTDSWHDNVTKTLALSDAAKGDR